MNKGIWCEQAENPRKSSNFGCSLFGSYFFRGEEWGSNMLWLYSRGCAIWQAKLSRRNQDYNQESAEHDPDKVPKRRQRQGRGHQKQLVTERKPKKKFCSSGTKWTKLKNEVCPTSSEKGEREQATKTCTHSFSLLKCGHVFFQNAVSERSTGDVHRNWLRFSRGSGVKVY